MKNQKMTATTAVLLFMGIVIGSGAAMAAYTANPRNPTTYWMGANGVWQTDATFEARSAGGLTKYAKRTVPLTVGSLGKLVKAAMGGPIGVAITAAMVGYAVWNETTGEFETGGSEPAPSTTSETDRYNNAWSTSNYIYSSVSDACEGHAQLGQNAGLNYTCESSNETTRNYVIRSSPTQTHSYSSSKILGCPSGYTTDGTGGCNLTDETQVEGYVAPTAITAEQVGQHISNNPTVTKQVGNDSIARGTWRGGNWPEMEQAAADIAASLDRIDSGTATQADIDAEKAMYAEPAPAEELQAIPDDYAREPTLQELRDHAATVAQNTATLADDGSQLPPWQPPTLPEDPVPDWDYTGQFTAFWDWAKGLFPFSFLLSPLTAFGGTAPPPIPDFSITVLGNSQTLSLQPVSVVFTWIRTANGILLLFGFYLIGLSIARRFI